MSNEPQSHVFERLVQPHMDRLYRFAWRLTSSKPEAEDLFQELLIKAFGKLDELARIDEPGSWLCRIMYNLFVDEHRRFKRHRMHIVDEAHLPTGTIADIAAGTGHHNPVAETERYERFSRLEKALDQLSDEHRIIVLLHDTEGYKLTEIQELTGTPVGTIKSRLHRARARLREILVADGTIS